MSRRSGAFVAFREIGTGPCPHPRPTIIKATLAFEPQLVVCPLERVSVNQPKQRKRERERVMIFDSYPLFAFNFSTDVVALQCCLVVEKGATDFGWALDPMLCIISKFARFGIDEHHGCRVTWPKRRKRRNGAQLDAVRISH